MKEIKAYVRKSILDVLLDALEALPDIPGITVTTVRGFGHPESGGPARLTEKIKLELVVPDDKEDEVVSFIAEHARTGAYGDGKIFVSDVCRAVRIRSGESGDAALLPSSA
jgi:nitrogen regulatory protein PII